jgi:hypothetical protein
MRTRPAIALVAFFVGMLGVLGVAALHLADAAPFGSAVMVGVVAAAVAVAVAGEQRAATALPALLLGVLASYPVALALGVIAFLGDEWQIAAGLLLILATAGFFGLLAVVRVARAFAPRLA